MHAAANNVAIGRAAGERVTGVQATGGLERKRARESIMREVAWARRWAGLGRGPVVLGVGSAVPRVDSGRAGGPGGSVGPPDGAIGRPPPFPFFIFSTQIKAIYKHNNSR
jgi:hypothetical protein